MAYKFVFMLKSLSIEWLKLKAYRTFWWLVGLFAVCLIASNYITYQIKAITSGGGSNGTLDMILGDPFGFPEVWQTVCYVSSYVLFIPGFLMLILITNEYNFKTHRQNIIDGMSRSTFAKTKMLTATLVSLLATLLVFIIAVITGIVSGSSFSFHGSIYLFYFLLQALTYTHVGLLIGTIVKKSGIAISIYFTYSVFIKNLLALLLNRYFDGIGGFTPIKSADHLIELPFFKQMTKTIIDQPNLTWLLIMTVLYLGGFYWATLKKYTSQDL